MKITFLGTGTSQGVPVITCKCNVCSSANPKDKRLRSSVLIETDKNTFVIDAGPDFRQQMLRENVEKLDALLITHGHKDHIGGLDDVRAFNYFLKKAVDVYAQKDVLEILKSDFFYAFEEEKYPGVPEIELHVVENQTFSINNDRITPIEVMHYKLPVFGYRIGEFTYITDANYINETELEKIKGSRIVVLNGLRRRKHISHFTLEEAVQLLERIRPEKAFLTHISHQLGLHDDVEKEIPEFIKLAYDGLTIHC
jgi:phosphoribosyl 1,2-cyclic phosphate phosphodiesterase